MRVLVVGGTGFLGGAIVEALFSAGHDVSVLSRGRTRRRLPEVTRLVTGDRSADLSALAGLEFDWVFDTCAYAPDHVTTLLDNFTGALWRYVLISSISAYGSFLQQGVDETAAVPEASPEDLAVAKAVAPEERASAAAYGASYGPLKRACEQAATTRLGGRATCLRVGLLVGAGDYSDRLTWWVRRIDQAREGRDRVPYPGPDGRLVQMIDVRDVAEFARLCAEQDRGGIWNVTGRPMPLRDLLEAVAQLAGSGARLTEVAPGAIKAAGLAPWSDIPLMAPFAPEFRYFLEVSADRAFDAGLVCRPVEETLEPLLDWDRSRRDVPLGVGMTAAQEAALLAS